VISEPLGFAIIRSCGSKGYNLEEKLLPGRALMVLSEQITGEILPEYKFGLRFFNVAFFTIGAFLVIHRRFCMDI
jgi:hypothetical protein